MTAAFAVVQEARAAVFSVVVCGCCLYLVWGIRTSWRVDKKRQVNRPGDESPVRASDKAGGSAQEELIAAQLMTARAQLKAAETQMNSSRTLSRPIIVPALEYDRERARFDLVLRNVGMGMALKAAWSISPAFEADLDQFIWPKKARLVPLQRGLVLEAIVREGDWFKALQAIPSGDYLVLINYLDLNGNLWQTQLLTNLSNEDAIGEHGFAALLAPEFQQRRDLLEDPSDPMENGLHPWWIPKRPPPERRRPHIVTDQ